MLVVNFGGASISLLDTEICSAVLRFLDNLMFILTCEIILFTRNLYKVGNLYIYN
jgi:hypothetical protein